MDGQRFDRWTKNLADTTTRRGMLRIVLGGALAAVPIARVRSGRAANDKVIICHLTGSATNPVVQIEVSVNAIPAHKAHGDAISPNFSSDDSNCGGCGIACDAASETCEDGTCVNRCEGVVCTAIDQCHEAGTCDPATGTCSNPAKPDGAACDDANACTQTDTCQNEACVGGAPANCDDGIACTVDKCDTATGCVHIPDDSLCVSDDPCFVGRCVADRGCVFEPVNSDQCQTCGPTGEVCNIAAGEHCCINRECCTADQYCGGNLGCCDNGPGPCRVG